MEDTEQKKLTVKEKLFVREYLADLNITQAAIRAGYSEKTAGRIGWVVFNKPAVQAAIKIEIGRMLERAEIKSWMVLRELGRIAFVNITEIATWDGRAISLKADYQLSDAAKAAVSEISEQKWGVRLKMHDKVAALKILADYCQLSEGEQAEDGAQTVFVAPEMSTEESWSKLPKK